MCVCSAVIITSCLGVEEDLLFCTPLFDITDSSPGTISLVMKRKRRLVLCLTGNDVIKIEFSFRS